MSLLISRCDELIAESKRVVSLQADGHLADQLYDLEAKAEENLDLATAVQNSMQQLLGGGVIDERGIRELSALSKQVNELKTRIATVRTRLRKKPHTVKEGNTWADCIQLAKSLLNEVTRSLRTQWESFVEETTQNKVDVFSAIEGLGQCRETVAELKNLEREAKLLLNALPSENQTIDKIRTIAKTMDVLISQIGIENEPEDMVSFLKRCAEGRGVPLSELTVEHLEWLRSKDFVDSLHIRA